MAAWSIGRQASTSFDRFLAYSDPSDFFVNFCPPDIATSRRGHDRALLHYDAVARRRTAGSLPEVETAGRAVLRRVDRRRSVGDPSARGRATPSVMFDTNRCPLEGRPIVVDGRRPDPAAADEIAVNERFAEFAGVTVGDELDLDLLGPGRAAATRCRGWTVQRTAGAVRIVGIERNVRGPPGRGRTSTSAIDETRVSAGPGCSAARSGTSRFSAVAVSPPTVTAPRPQAAVEQAFAGRFYHVDSVSRRSDEQEPIAEAIRYEAGGTMLFGAITALAAVVFVGQAVSRQSRREWADGRDTAGARDVSTATPAWRRWCAARSPG